MLFVNFYLPELITYDLELIFQYCNNSPYSSSQHSKSCEMYVCIYVDDSHNHGSSACYLYYTLQFNEYHYFNQSDVNLKTGPEDLQITYPPPASFFPPIKYTSDN